MPDHVHSGKNDYPGHPSRELEHQAAARSVFHLPEIIEDIQLSANDPTHEGRTRVLIDSPEHVTLVSGYQPGEGEVLHAHPTRNTLLFLAGTFDLGLSIVMVSIVEGMPTSAPGYSVPVDLPPTV